MKKILVMATLLVVTAAGCGSSDNAVSVSTAGDQTANTSAAPGGGTQSSVPTEYGRQHRIRGDDPGQEPQ